jgi:hypothetical protein
VRKKYSHNNKKSWKEVLTRVGIKQTKRRKL